MGHGRSIVTCTARRAGVSWSRTLHILRVHSFVSNWHTQQNTQEDSSTTNTQLLFAHSLSQLQAGVTQQSTEEEDSSAAAVMEGGGAHTNQATAGGVDFSGLSGANVTGISGGNVMGEGGMQGPPYSAGSGVGPQGNAALNQGMGDRLSGEEEDLDPLIGGFDGYGNRSGLGVGNGIGIAGQGVWVRVQTGDWTGAVRVGCVVVARGVWCVGLWCVRHILWLLALLLGWGSTQMQVHVVLCAALFMSC